MLATLKDLARRLAPPPDVAHAAADEHTLQLATAVLLVEVMRADGHFDATERASVTAALVAQFGLDDDEAARLSELGEQATRSSTDLFGFTSLVDARFEMHDKLRIVERLWAVAYADGRLGEHERHLMWRIADLLHVPHGAYVNARMRAQAAAG